MYTLFNTPKNVFVLFIESIKLFAASFSKILLPMFILILSIASQLIYYKYQITAHHITAYHFNHDASVHLTPLSIIGRIAFTALFAFLIIWIIRKIDLSAKNKIESLLKTIAFSVKKWPKIFLVLLALSILSSTFFVLIYSLAIYFHAAPSLAFNIPSLLLSFLYIPLLFIGFIIILDETGIFTAIKKSFRLIWGRWWRTYGAFLLFFLLSWIIMIIITIAITFILTIILHPTSKFFQLFIYISTFLIASFWFVWFTNFIYIIYHNLKLLKQKT